MTFWALYWIAFVACMVFSIITLAWAEEDRDSWGFDIEGAWKKSFKEITIGDCMIYLVISFIPCVNFIIAIAGFFFAIRLIFCVLCDVAEKPAMKKTLFKNNEK